NSPPKGGGFHPSQNYKLNCVEYLFFERFQFIFPYSSGLLEIKNKLKNTKKGENEHERIS
ncbi:hypothetical protein, partial [Paludibacter sp. 221]|uniref:hypothetical protein n=1 Tax=Paludibacter sp. 221 TaxID=2302939 RepID=UPI0019455F22